MNDFDLLQTTNCSHFYFKKVGSVLGSGSGRNIPDTGSIFDVSYCPGSFRASASSEACTVHYSCSVPTFLVPVP
jgi:hypothetical protein